MHIARIVSITPDGTWNSSHGLIYQLLVEFDDGARGQANAKSNNPPYRVGDEAGYEITGQYPGGDKIKVTADPYGKGGQSRNAAPAARPPARTPQRQTPQPAPARQETPAPLTTPFAANGQRAGMIVKAAVDIIIHNAAHRPARPTASGVGVSEQNKLIELSTLQHDVETISATIMAAALRLEQGHVKVQDPGSDVPY